ncbi:MAG: type II toxin-antitoxin system VapC family toxin [Planctomycetaceae bacterium]|jgi:predicted nucleic acid-binding protein|nr:type II toxin-antitoxin system VapC family toxin [Planctomycetaceae bacterium]
MIIDTDVLIWYFKGNKNALNIIKKYIPFNISVITYMELIQGMRNKNELQTLKKYLKKWNVKIIQINENISVRSMFLVENYYLSNSLELGDAIIGVTARENQETLLTANYKHYKIIQDLNIEIFRPDYES